MAKIKATTFLSFNKTFKKNNVTQHIAWRHEIFQKKNLVSSPKI
jgi:hypothetical protein